MSIRTLLIPLDGAIQSKPALDAGFALGRDINAHISVLHMRPDARESVPLLGEGVSGAMVEEMIELADKEAGERAARARQMFDEARDQFNLTLVDKPSFGGEASVSWSEDTGREDEATAWRGRLSDLIVVTRPTEDSEASASLTLNAALVETGRPVLVVPANTPAGFGRRVCISWNGSPEAARAVHAAMPLLERSDKVTVLTADTDRTPPSAAPELADHLAWHGITAETRILSNGSGIGADLLAACKDADADMLVMGAYTHSRLRQLIMGGVTRHVLDNAELPVLMSH